MDVLSMLRRRKGPTAVVALMVALAIRQLRARKLNGDYNGDSNLSTTWKNVVRSLVDTFNKIQGTDERQNAYKSACMIPIIPLVALCGLDRKYAWPAIVASQGATIGLLQMDPLRRAITITSRQWMVIIYNLLFGMWGLRYTIHKIFDSKQLYHVKSIRDVKAWQWLYLPLWAVMNEVFFYCGHRALHLPSVYGTIHKMHHHFKITSQWATFYSHPLDHWFILITGMAPVWCAVKLGFKIPLPVYIAWTLGAQTTFIASHHNTVEDREKFLPNKKKGRKVPTEETYHMIHHTKFNYNYGNFHLLDDWYNSLLRPYEKLLALITGKQQQTRNDVKKTAHNAAAGGDFKGPERVDDGVKA